MAVRLASAPLLLLLAATARAQCDFTNLQTHLEPMNAACCADASTCPLGFPETCPTGCFAALADFKAKCESILESSVGASIKDSIETAQAGCGVSFFLTEPTQLVAGNLLGTVDLVSDLEVGFEITPGSEVSPDWTSILHFTSTGENCCNYGDRVPGVWFYPGTHRLHIIDGQGEDGNDECPIEEELPVGVPTAVRIALKPTALEIYYNGELKCTEPRADRAPFRGVQVFAADPFYAAAPASVDDVYIYALRGAGGASASRPGKRVFLENPTQLAQSTLLGKVDVPVEYEVGFTITPGADTEPGWGNIMHFSGTGGNCCNYGDRIPAVWFYGGTRKLYVIDGQAANGDDQCPIERELPAGQASAVRMVMGASKVEVFVDGALVCSEDRADRSSFEGASVFASDPWHNPAVASIDDFYMLVPGTGADAAFQKFRFNLDPAGDNSGLRGWDCCVQLGEIALYDREGAYLAGAEVTNPGGNNPGGESVENVYDQVDEVSCHSGTCTDFDGAAPKWLDFNFGDLIIEFDAPVSIGMYNWMTANDAPNRDPTKWTLDGAVLDGDWVVLDDTYATSPFAPPDGRYTWVGPFAIAPPKVAGGCAPGSGLFFQAYEPGPEWDYRTLASTSGILGEVWNGWTPVVEHADMLSEIWYPADDDFVNNIAGFSSTDNFAMRWSGYVTIAAPGDYTFMTESDDGSLLYIDGEVVVDNDGLHGNQQRDGTATLSAGPHPITIAFFENNGGARLQVSWGKAGEELQPLGSEVLSNDVTCEDNTDTAECGQDGFWFEVYAPGDGFGWQDLKSIADTAFGDVWNSWTPLEAHTERESDLLYGDDASFVNDIDGFTMTDKFVMRWRGKLSVGAHGAYGFKTISDDGSLLYIDEQLVVDNDGLHSSKEVEGATDLTTGAHALVVLFYENSGGARMELWWTPRPGGEMVPIGGLDVTNDVHCDGKAESCEEVVSYNTESYDTILARELGPAKAVTFTLTAPNDAHIGFFSKGKSLDEVYEVVLGGWGGTQSVIRRSNQGDNEVVAATPDIVSAEEPREFWADVRQGVVRVGTTHEVGDESSIVMQWKDPNPFEATYVGFMSGWGAEGHWKVCFDAGIADAPTETYIGCYEDSSERDVEVNMGRMEESTVEQCATLCESSAYFALQDATECYCDNAKPEGKRMPDSECNKPCTGSGDMCGGAWRNSIYERATAAPCNSAQIAEMNECTAACSCDWSRAAAVLGDCVNSKSGRTAFDDIDDRCKEGPKGGKGGGGH